MSDRAKQILATAEARQRSARVYSALVGAGCILTIPAYVAAIASAGIGHGDYLAARLLFPVPLLLTRVTGDTITVISLGLAACQFPAYGWMAARAIADKRPAAVVVATVVHVLGAVLTLWLLPNFS